MGRSFYFNDAWTRHEDRAKRLAHEEGLFTGHENAPHRKVNGVDQVVDGALGLDGSDFHMGGERVTKLKEERLTDGSFNVYWQNEHGGTYRQRWEKAGDGRHVSAERPRRIFTF